MHTKELENFFFRNKGACIALGQSVAIGGGDGVSCILEAGVRAEWLCRQQIYFSSASVLSIIAISVLSCPSPAQGVTSLSTQACRAVLKGMGPCAIS